MHLGLVPVVRVLVRLTRREVEGAADLLVEQDVLHGIGDAGVDGDGEFAELTRTLVHIVELDEVRLVAAGARRLHDLAVLDHVADAREELPVVHGRDVVRDRAVHGARDRGGVDLAVGDVLLAVALDRRDPLDRERNVRPRTDDADLVGSIHERDERVHGLGHALVVGETGVEVEVRERLLSHTGAVGHRVVGVAHHAPPRVVNTLLDVDRLPEVGLPHRALVVGNIRQREGVVVAAHADERIRLLHDSEMERSERTDLRLVHVQEHPPHELAGEVEHHGHAAELAHDAHELERELSREVTLRLDVDQLPSSDLHRSG